MKRQQTVHRRHGVRPEPDRPRGKSGGRMTPYGKLSLLWCPELAVFRCHLGRAPAAPAKRVFTRAELMHMCQADPGGAPTLQAFIATATANPNTWVDWQEGGAV